MNEYTEEFYVAESKARDIMAGQGWEFGCEDYAGRDELLESLAYGFLPDWTK